MGEGIFASIIILGAGIFSILGAVMNWDWFIESRKARLFVKLFGRTGCRIFYGILGILLAVGGFLILVSGGLS
jgi:small neutral amino acid transporter SnatA (MarC family)